MEIRHCLGEIKSGEPVCFVGGDRRIVDFFGPRFTVERWHEGAAYPILGTALMDSEGGIVTLQRREQPGSENRS